MGPPTAERREVARLLGGADADLVDQVDVPISTVGESMLRTADLVAIVGLPEGPAPEERAAIERVARGPVPAALIIAGYGIDEAGGPTGSYPGGLAAVLDVDLDRPAEEQHGLASTLLDLLGTRSLALAREVPGLREPLAERLIRDTSRANAQFALLSTLPAWIPLVGALSGSAADVLILTKNQMLLVFKLAGIYGRDLGQWRQILIEIVPVVGGAFFWRSIARALVGLLPTPIAAVPKTTVAFVGTATVGELARRYYRDGIRIDPTTLREIQRHALQRVQEAAKLRPTSSA
jgi:uncharacterized protein (DUF697 family)